ncbi:golgin subfamily A member 6-like protein 22 isoform X2 [Syngnathoides biaculeatus]|uniref:golgin subfamily A member 6-like protein 22 isoform X2 n=1 Tax=Syngnathoides biaculeatus TaxID=300417 RepID=UPI002ADE0F97|nr:golgin subfamily A member 6-like protein 22 isoform X2 [Syngnathoides biaculeatus]
MRDSWHRGPIFNAEVDVFADMKLECKFASACLGQLDIHMYLGGKWCDRCVKMCARSRAEYEKELSGPKEEKKPQRQLLDAVFNLQPQIVLCRADITENLRTKWQETEPSHIKEEMEDEEVHHIKEEEEMIFIKNKAEEVQHHIKQEEEDITKFPMTCVSLKSEDEGQSEESRGSEPPSSSSSQHMTTEGDGDYNGDSHPEEKEQQEEEHVREVRHHVTPPGDPKHHENPSDGGPTKRQKKQRKDCRILDRAVEDSLVEFFRQNELLWNSLKTDYRNKAKRQRILETKATELQISVDHLWTWFKSLRDMFTKMDKKKSEDGQKQLTERETWIKEKFGFFHQAINHRSKPVKSLKAIIAESQGDLDKAEWAAAEERVEVDEFDDNVTERQPTQALSVSSDIATLQRQSKESGDILTMLRDQLPPPEPVTERTTYAAYVKSVLLGLNSKDFRRARKGINKVLKPFCESESSDEDSENRSNRAPSRQDSIQSFFTGDTPSSQPRSSKKLFQCQHECQSQQRSWQPPPSEWGTPTPQAVSVFNSVDSAYMPTIQDQQGCESHYRKY